MFQDIAHRANTLNKLRVSYIFNNYLLTHHFYSLESCLLSPKQSPTHRTLR